MKKKKKKRLDSELYLARYQGKIYKFYVNIRNAVYLLFSGIARFKANIKYTKVRLKAE